ncbi:hypothetical protein Hanom_Chr01g00050681 [Helianthus anomalus]
MKLIPIISAIRIKVSLHCWITWITLKLGLNGCAHCNASTEQIPTPEALSVFGIPSQKLEEWMLCGEKLLE